MKNKVRAKAPTSARTAITVGADMKFLTSKAFIASFCAVLGATMIGIGIDNQKATIIVPGISFVMIGIVVAIVLSIEMENR